MKFNPVCLCPKNRLELHGNYVILRYIGRVAAIRNFYGDDAFHAAQVCLSFH